MGAPSALSPKRAYDEVWEVIGTFTIGTDGAHTKQFGGRGIASVARDAAGQFTVTFTDVGSQLVDLDVRVWRTGTTGTPLVSAPTKDSFSRTAKTAKFETWTSTGTTAKADPASGDRVTIRATFLK
jgi:hypothetical protein